MQKRAVLEYPRARSDQAVAQVRAAFVTAVVAVVAEVGAAVVVLVGELRGLVAGPVTAGGQLRLGHGAPTVRRSPVAEAS